jgi:flagellar protein FlgJ
MADFNPLDANGAFLEANAQRVERKLTDVHKSQTGIDQSEADLKDASEQFEALLLNFMIREMRATVPESTLFERSMAEEIFTGMLDERTAGMMAKNGDVGLSRLIFDQLKGNR